MGRKSKATYQEEFRKARLKYMSLVREYTRRHPNTHSWDNIDQKVHAAEEKCFLLLRKVHGYSGYDHFIP